MLSTLVFEYLTGCHVKYSNSFVAYIDKPHENYVNIKPDDIIGNIEDIVSQVD